MVCFKIVIKAGYTKPLQLALLLVSGCITCLGQAQETIELDTTTITGNTELPKSLYVVPWQDREIERDDEYRLSLHNLYGDLFDPRMPDYLDAREFQSAMPPAPSR